MMKPFLTLLAGAFLIVTLPATGHTLAADEDERTAEKQKPVRTPSGNGLVPRVRGFDFEPWYELDDSQLWQHIGWKVRLTHLPDNTDRFVELMQSELFKDMALDIDWQVVLALGVDRLAELPNIESITLSGGVPIIGEQFAAIAALPRLRHLDLRSLPIGKEAMLLHPRMPQMERLNLSYTGTSGYVMRTVLGKDENRVRDLSLRGETLVTGKVTVGAVHHPPQTRMFWFSHLKQLRRLSIPASGIADFEDLTLLPELRVLDLHDATSPPHQLSDRSIAALARIPKLRVLRLPLPPTAKQLRQLRPLTKLERVDIAGDAQPTDEFRQQLADTLPNVRTWVDMSGLGAPMALNLRDATLGSFVQLIATQSGVPIHIDADALERSGIDLQNEPLDQILPRMTLGTALSGLLGDFGLVVIPSPRGLTVTSEETESVWEQEYDLSPLLESLDAGDHHAARLAQVLESLTSELNWGRDATLLLPGKPDTDTKTTTQILSRGTQLVVIAGAKGQRTVARIVDQLLNPESLLTGVDFRSRFDRSHWNGWGRDDDQPTSHPVAVNFADTPIVDALEYLARSFERPVILDREAVEEAGIKLDEPINMVDDALTFSDILDRLLQPRKLVWINDGDHIVVTSLDRAQHLTSVTVHQFDDNHVLGEPPSGRHLESRQHQFRGILSRSGMPKARYEFWLNRTLVAGPFQSQLKLSRLVHGWLDNLLTETASKDE